jgi:hypothetical protein
MTPTRGCSASLSRSLTRTACTGERSTSSRTSLPSISSEARPPPRHPNPPYSFAETTDDLLDNRESVAVSLRQAGYEVLPESDLPRDSEASFVNALKTDLSRVRVFAQLLGPYEGRKAPEGETSFVALQASQAIQAREQRNIEILQWCAPEIDLARVASPAYRELLQGRYAQSTGLEEFKRQILKALAPPAGPQGPPGPLSGSRSDLYIYVNADRVDRAMADRVGGSTTSTPSGGRHPTRGPVPMT